MGLFGAIGDGIGAVAGGVGSVAGKVVGGVAGGVDDSLGVGAAELSEEEKLRRQQLQAQRDSLQANVLAGANGPVTAQSLVNRANGVSTRNAPSTTATGATAAPVGAAHLFTGQGDQRRAQEDALISAIGGFRAGQAAGGPSAAENLAIKGTDDAISAARAAAFSTPGVSPSEQARIASGGAGSIKARSNAELAALRAQEEERRLQRVAGADALTASVLANSRGQDINQASTQAGFDQAAGLLGAQLETDVSKFNASELNEARRANAELQLRQRGLNDEQIARFLAMADNVTQSDANREASVLSALIGEESGVRGIEAQSALAAQQNAADRSNAVLGGLFSAVGSAVAA